MGAKKKWKGKKFGLWTCLTDSRVIDGNYKIKCQCECGTIQEVLTRSLSQKDSTHCGCLRDRKYIGKEMNNLVVLGLSDQKTGVGRKRWVCECVECGKIHHIASRIVSKGDGKCKCGRYIEVGQVFGKLTVIGRFGKEGDYKIKCRCECGNVVKKGHGQLLDDGTTDCGCVRKIGPNLTHGKTSTVEFQCWVRMRNRCQSVKNQNYESYGGRGIEVCERWDKFENFLEDMGERPSKDYSLDRIDVNGDYCLENCRWATYNVQSGNTRKNLNRQYTGVRLAESGKRHIARICIKGVKEHIGTFDTAYEAAREYDDRHEDEYLSLIHI